MTEYVITAYRGPNETRPLTATIEAKHLTDAIEKFRIKTHQLICELYTIPLGETEEGFLFKIGTNSVYGQHIIGKIIRRSD